MWLRSLRDKDVRYRIYPAYPDVIELPGRESTIGFLMTPYVRDHAGNWKQEEGRSIRYITIEALLDGYIAENTYLNTYVEDLELFKKDAFERASNEKQEGFNKLYDIYKDGLVNVTTKVDENERHTEDICALHSGESETDPEAAPTGVQE